MITTDRSVRAYLVSILAAVTTGMAGAAFALKAPDEIRSAEDLRYFTEQYPPYNYEADGELRGIMIDVWEELWDRMGADLDRDDITLAPWARGYHEVQTWPGTALAAMTYTESRAEYLAFVGPVVDVRFVLLAPKSAGIELNGLQELTDHAVGTVRDDIGEQLLVQRGFDADIFERLEDPAQAAAMLEAGRIDMFAYQEDVAMFEMEAEGLDVAEYEAVHVLDTGNLQLSFHVDTPQRLLDEFQAHLDDMRDDGTLDAIIDRHIGF